VDERVIEPHVAYWITDVLADNSARIPAFGESSFLALTRPAAVKTGTTTDWRDNWTVGYTPQLAVGVWVGNADNSPMVDISGVSGAAPIWNALMELALRSYPVQQFSRPPDMVEVEVCADSGKLPGPYCPHRRREWFPPDRKPKGVCSMHRMVQIDRRSGQLATPDTPSEYLIEKTELLLPADAAAWVAEHSQDGSIRLSVRQVVDEALTPTHHGPGLELTHPHADSVFRINPAVPADLQRMEIKVLQVGLGEPLAVVVFVDGKEVGAPAEAPYTLLWQLEAGTHVLYAEAMTSSGESWRSEPVRITVLQ
jgi:membrane carboxypeptidase/penicillin-binding protein PbpC